MSIKQQLQEQYEDRCEKETIFVPHGSTSVRKDGVIPPKFLFLKEIEDTTLSMYVDVYGVGYTLYRYEREKDELVYQLDL